MKNLQEATERICELKGSLVAMDALLASLLQGMTADSRAQLLRSFADTAEVARTVLLHAPISESTVASFERDVSRFSALIVIDPVAPDGGRQPC